MFDQKKKFPVSKFCTLTFNYLVKCSWFDEFLTVEMNFLLINIITELKILVVQNISNNRYL